LIIKKYQLIKKGRFLLICTLLGTIFTGITQQIQMYFDYRTAELRYLLNKLAYLKAFYAGKHDQVTL
jgi:hypothetical protein